MNPFRKPTDRPAVTPGVNPNAYHAIGHQFDRGDARRTMSRSELQEFAVNPHRWLSGVQEEDTDALQWGLLVDCLVLTPHRLETDYAIAPETYPSEPLKKGGEPVPKRWNWNATYCKEWRALREKEGKVVVKSDDASEAWKAREILFRDKKVAALIAASQTQVQVLVDYHDEQTGIVVPIKCLLDLAADPASEFGTMLGDLKTTYNAAVGPWARHCFNQGYHIQAALYMDAYNAATGLKYNQWAHVIQESAPPYEVGRRVMYDYETETNLIKMGRLTYRKALRDYCQCLATGFWPGYDDLSPSGWTCVEAEAWMLKQEATV